MPQRCNDQLTIPTWPAAHYGDGDRSVQRHEHPEQVSSVTGSNQPELPCACKRVSIQHSCRKAHVRKRLVLTETSRWRPAPKLVVRAGCLRHRIQSAGCVRFIVTLQMFTVGKPCAESIKQRLPRTFGAPVGRPTLPHCLVR